mmetsp:Transcript_138953/g.432295  ORF Transcript_138953/g.432295 Transcript_138953/m.432295 type:complete len:537 (-) Transcript_138953:277-1887(-)
MCDGCIDPNADQGALDLGLPQAARPGEVELLEGCADRGHPVRRPLRRHSQRDAPVERGPLDHLGQPFEALQRLGTYVVSLIAFPEEVVLEALPGRRPARPLLQEHAVAQAVRLGGVEVLGDVLAVLGLRRPEFLGFLCGHGRREKGADVTPPGEHEEKNAPEAEDVGGGRLDQPPHLRSHGAGGAGHRPGEDVAGQEDPREAEVDEHDMEGGALAGRLRGVVFLSAPGRQGVHLLHDDGVGWLDVEVEEAAGVHVRHGLEQLAHDPCHVALGQKSSLPLLNVLVEVPTTAVVHDEEVKLVYHEDIVEPDDVWVVQHAEALNLPVQRLRDIDFPARHLHLLDGQKEAAQLALDQLHGSKRAGPQPLGPTPREIFPLEVGLVADAAAFRAERLPPAPVHRVQKLPENCMEGVKVKVHLLVGRLPLRHTPLLVEHLARGHGLVPVPALGQGGMSATRPPLDGSTEEREGGATYSDKLVDAIAHGVELRPLEHRPSIDKCSGCVLHEQPLRLALHSPFGPHLCDPYEVLLCRPAAGSQQF